MTGTAVYPNNTEIRAWANAKRPGYLSEQGQLPRYVILAWNKAHPDRPYVKAEAYHGTIGGYSNRGCRCERCSAAIAAYNHDIYTDTKAERDDELADALLDGQVSS